MKTRVRQWGNSLALRIPREYAAELQVEQGSLVEITVEDGALVVRALRPSLPTLEQLLAGVTEENLHGEVTYGPPVGNEAG
jgi:antitoxin MazE